MTENEAKEIVKKLRNKAELFKNSGFAVDGIVKSFEDSANAIETLSEEIQQYRAIGTVEEFKALKVENEELHCEIQAINATMDLLENEIRAKAIDEFAHQLKESLNQEFPRNYESTRPYFSLENARLLVDEIAEQMKAGGIDG